MTYICTKIIRDYMSMGLKSRNGLITLLIILKTFNATQGQNLAVIPTLCAYVIAERAMLEFI